MKKWILIIIAVICLTGFLYVFLTQQNSNPKLGFLENKIPSPVKQQSIILDIDKNPIRVSWVFSQPEDIELYSNLSKKQTSENIKSDKNCKILVNGGFYSKENTHLGLFVSNFETLSKSLDNPLLNGYFWISSNRADISSFAPTANPKFTLQTGPILIENSNPLMLNINNDYPARRVVAGITEKNEIIFLAFFREKSNFEGPLLEDLPNAIALFSKRTNIEIIDAINLDGGSASAFLTEFESLPELSQIGSYFCGR